MQVLANQQGYFVVMRSVSGKMGRFLGVGNLVSLVKLVSLMNLMSLGNLVIIFP